MSGEAYRPVPRYGVREVAPGIRVNGCFRDPSRPHGEGHNAVCVCACAWCVDERAAVGPVQGELGLSG